MIAAALAAFFCLCAEAQTAVPANRTGAIDSLLNLPVDAPSFQCEFQAENPERNFGRGFDIPFVVRVPLSEAQILGRPLNVFVRADRSDGSTPATYFERQYELPRA